MLSVLLNLVYNGSSSDHLVVESTTKDHWLFVKSIQISLNDLVLLAVDGLEFELACELINYLISGVVVWYRRESFPSKYALC